MEQRYGCRIFLFIPLSAARPTPADAPADVHNKWIVGCLTLGFPSAATQLGTQGYATSPLHLSPYPVAMRLDHCALSSHHHARCHEATAPILGRFPAITTAVTSSLGQKLPAASRTLLADMRYLLQPVPQSMAAMPAIAESSEGTLSGTSPSSGTTRSTTTSPSSSGPHGDAEGEAETAKADSRPAGGTLDSAGTAL